jgi:hypothetical protein
MIHFITAVPATTFRAQIAADLDIAPEQLLIDR